MSTVREPSEHRRRPVRVDLELPRTFYFGLLPWLVFAVTDRSAGLGPTASAATAAGVALSIVVLETRSRRAKPLGVIASLVFTSLTIASLTSKHALFLVQYDRAIAAAALTVITFFSPLVTPLTTPFTRETVPPRRWRDSRFDTQNRTLTLLWALAFAAISISLLIGNAIGGRDGTTLFNWLLPIVVVVAVASCAIPETERDAQQAISGLFGRLSDARRANAEPTPEQRAPTLRLVPNKRTDALRPTVNAD